MVKPTGYMGEGSTKVTMAHSPEVQLTLAHEKISAVDQQFVTGRSGLLLQQARVKGDHSVSLGLYPPKASVASQNVASFTSDAARATSRSGAGACPHVVLETDCRRAVGSSPNPC